MMYPILASATVAIATIALPADDGARESVTDPTKINMIMGIITDLWTW
jgi:hypothetical protein